MPVGDQHKKPACPPSSFSPFPNSLFVLLQHPPIFISPILSNNMPPIHPEIIWDPKPQSNAGDPNLPETFYHLNYNGHALMFTVDLCGKGVSLDTKRCPMWICLHGGGTTDSENNNDTNWTKARAGYFGHMVNKYAEDHGPVIMVCPRGVSTTERGKNTAAWDDWNLHFRQESYVLMEQMIIQLLQTNTVIDAPYSVDPNRVYLWGFSAGGDGAFNIGARIPDRFAAVIANAGHPNGAPFVNFANTGMILQVGERDVLKGANDRRISRAKVYLEEARAPLITLKQTHDPDGRDNLYRFECMVVQTEDAPESSKKGLYYHNSWSSRDTGTTLKVTAPKDGGAVEAWLAQQDLQDVEWLKKREQERIWTRKQGEWWNTSTTINPLILVNSDKHKYTRNPTPARVIWDLHSRPPRPEGSPKGWEKRMFYWLYVRQSPLDTVAEGLVKLGPEDARLLTKTNQHLIHVARPNSHMGYLLKESMITGNQTITLRINTAGTTKDFPLGTLAVQSKIKAQTRELSGDPELEFAAMVYLTGSKDDWKAVVAQSLDG